MATGQSKPSFFEDGAFREDLYYRLNGFGVTLPELTERPEEIPLLVEHFLEFYVRQFGKESTAFSPGALKALEGYSWPGNIRQLENAVARGVLLAINGIINCEDLGELPEPKRQNSDSGGEYNLKTIEKKVIQKVMKITDNNGSRASQILGISRRTLYNKMRFQ